MPNHKYFIISIGILLIFTVGHQDVKAQQQLPFGAKAQLGINKGVISDVAFTPDGTQIAVASSIGIWLSDAATGTETALEPATPFGVSAIAFSPDGKTLATGSEEGAIWLRRIDIGAIRHFLSVHTRDIFSVAFSPDAKTLASGSRDGTIGLWDTETGKLRSHLTGHTDAVNIVAFSPDGKTLASWSAGGAILLWDWDKIRPDQ